MDLTGEVSPKIAKASNELVEVLIENLIVCILNEWRKDTGVLMNCRTESGGFIPLVNDYSFSTKDRGIWYILEF